MKVLLLKFWLVIPLCCCEAKFFVSRSCNDLLSINCSNDVIAIYNGTESIVPKVLEQCNARHKCEVPNHHGQCVSIEYWCRLQAVANLETKKSSTMHMRIKQRAVGLMSQDYHRGIYQSAEHINCNITFANQEYETPKEIKFTLYDFASFANSTDFCLKVEDTTMPSYCSGSKKYFTEYGPFNMTNKIQFSITLASTSKAIQAPKIRFWFDVFVVGGVPLDDMVCISKPASSNGNDNKGLTNKSAVTIISSVSVVGGFLLIITVAFTIVTVLRCRLNKYHSSGKKANDSGEYADLDDINDDQYMDIDSVDSSGEEITKKLQKDSRKSKLKGQASDTTKASDLGSDCPLPSAPAVPQEISPMPGCKASDLSRKSCANFLPVDDTKETGSQASWLGDIYLAPIDAGTAIKAEQDEKKGKATTNENVATITECNKSELPQESAKGDDTSQDNHENFEPNNTEPRCPEPTKADIHVPAEKDQLEEPENGSTKQDTDTGSRNEYMSLKTKQSSEERNVEEDEYSSLGNTDKQ